MAILTNLFCPAYTLNLIHKIILKSIRLKLAILPPKILQKITKVAISQNPILLKCHSPKSLLFLHFSMNLSETFRININRDFAQTNHGRFFGSNFFGGLNQKSAMISMCKIHIYIDSERFRQIHRKNVGGVGFLVNDTWAKWDFEKCHFGQFFEYFGGYNCQFWSD